MTTSPGELPGCLRLAFPLSGPLGIVTATVEGRQPPTLTARSLLAAELPAAWPDQRAALGFS